MSNGFDLHDKERIIRALVEDLVQMHRDTAIELQYWENARLLVEKYYNVYTSVTIGAKKETND